jgi:CheY-like chemotaxis protein
MAQSEPRGTVLLVESDADERDRLAACLEDAGLQVTVCPGPTGPDYTCVGARTLECPLAAGVSVIVLDMALEGEALMEGTVAEELLGVYLFGGNRVIALGDRLRDQVPGQLIRLRRHPEPNELLTAVASLAERGGVDRL